MSETHLSDDLLNEYLDDFLASETRSSVETHLMGCEGCTARVEFFRILFAELDQLPDIPLEKDLANAVLQAVRPTVVLSRPWQWAIWAQLGVAAWVLALALPVLNHSELFLSLQLMTGPFVNQLTILVDYFIQIIQSTNEILFQFLDSFQAIQIPNLSFSLVVITPILLATGLLWLIGNGLLLKNRI